MSSRCDSVPSLYIIFFLGILLVPTHILLSVCGDTETESDSLISKIIGTVRQGRFVANFRNAFLPNNQWGPVSIQEKRDWQIYCENESLYQWLPKCIRRKLRSVPSSPPSDSPSHTKETSTPQ